MSRVRVGIIGAGFAADIHARAYGQLAGLGVELVAVTSAHRANAERFASRYGIKHVYDDHHGILQREDVDLVDLCVPNFLHKPLAIEAAEMGKHIVCEKPLTGYFGEGRAKGPVGATPRAKMLEGALANADQMLEAARRCGVKLMYAENWLYAPAVEKAKRLIRESKGTIMEIKGQECHSGSHSPFARAWRYAGGGALARMAVHPIGMGMHLKAYEGMLREGRPITVESVAAEVGYLTEISSFKDEPRKWMATEWEDVENWATVLITFSDGSKGVFSASDIVLGGMEATLEVRLSNARIKCNMTRSTALEAYAPDSSIFAGEYLTEKLETKAGWSFPSLNEDWVLGYIGEMRDFVETVLEDRASLSDAHLGREVVRVVYSAYLAAEEGRRVSL